MKFVAIGNEFTIQYVSQVRNGVNVQTVESIPKASLQKHKAMAGFGISDGRVSIAVRRFAWSAGIVQTLRPAKIAIRLKLLVIEIQVLGAWSNVGVLPHGWAIS